MAVGVVEQEQPRKYVRVTKPIYFGDGEKHAYIVPYNGLRVTCEIDFDHPEIGRQKIDLDVNPQSFGEEISRARTFGFQKDVDRLHAAGLALGGGYHNAVVLGEDRVMNEEGLRWQNEFVRHIILFRAGHDLMNKLIQKLLENEDSYVEMELGAGLTDQAVVQKTLWV